MLGSVVLAMATFNAAAGNMNCDFTNRANPAGLEKVKGQTITLSVDPESGSTITPGTVINLYFSEEMDAKEFNNAVTVTDMATGTEYKLPLDYNWNTFDFSNLQFTMPKDLADGDYSAHIEADWLSGINSGESYGEITLNYTVENKGGDGPGGPATLEVKSFSPASEQVETLSNAIKISFKSQLASLADNARAVLKNDETGKTYTGVMTILTYMEKTVEIVFNYGEEADAANYLCVPGKYTMTIAAGSVIGQDGGENEEIINSWEVTGPVNLNDIQYASVLPKNQRTLTSLGKIQITFPQNPVLTKKLDAMIYVNDFEYNFVLENNRLTLTLSPEITADGTYIVTLPEGSVYSLENAHGNEAITLTYTIGEITGVESLHNVAETTSVYNCQGICINRMATVRDLGNMPAGMYIVDGKKLIKR